MTAFNKQEERRRNKTVRPGPVAEAVQSARAGLHVNQTNFGEMIGVKQSTVAQLEGGRRKPSPGLAYRLAKISGQPIETFVEAYYEEQIG